MTGEGGATDAQDLDSVAQREAGGGELHGAVGLRQHLLKGLHLVIGDGGDGMASQLIGEAGLVGHEGLDEGEVDDEAALTLGGMDEDQRRDDHTLQDILAAIAPDAQLLLGGYIDIVAEFLHALTDEFLGVGADIGDEPVTL